MEESVATMGTQVLTTFGGTASALVIFAIWSNKKFNCVEKQISYIKGKLGIET